MKKFSADFKPVKLQEKIGAAKGSLVMKLKKRQSKAVHHDHVEFATLTNFRNNLKQVQNTVLIRINVSPEQSQSYRTRINFRTEETFGKSRHTG